MRYTMKTAVYGSVYHAICRKELKSADAVHTRRTILYEYKEIWKRAGEVGEKNKLYSAYAISAKEERMISDG